MNCKKFELTASVYMDRQLPHSEAAQYRAHVLACAGCREHLSEIEIVSSTIRRAGRVEVPRELRSYVMAAAIKESSREISVSHRMVDWMLRLNPQLLSYATGMVVSILLFAFMFSGFKPIPVNKESLGKVFVFPAVSSPEREFLAYNGLPSHSDAGHDQHSYQLPRVLGNSSMGSSFGTLTPSNDSMCAIIEVAPDGRASFVDWIQEPKNAKTVEQFWWSLTDRSFQPAIVEGKPATTQIIFISEKIDVSG